MHHTKHAWYAHARDLPMCATTRCDHIRMCIMAGSDLHMFNMAWSVLPMCATAGCDLSSIGGGGGGGTPRCRRGGCSNEGGGERHATPLGPLSWSAHAYATASQLPVHIMHGRPRPAHGHHALCIARRGLRVQGPAAASPRGEGEDGMLPTFQLLSC